MYPPAELASNAARHGAFSVPGGEADIRWLIGAGQDGAPRFHLEWRERGGPPVSAPQWKGFGHIALERIAPGSLDGTGKLEFTPEGVSWSLEGSPSYFLQPGAEAA